MTRFWKWFMAAVVAIGFLDASASAFAQLAGRSMMRRSTVTSRSVAPRQFQRAAPTNRVIGRSITPTPKQAPPTRKNIAAPSRRLQAAPSNRSFLRQLPTAAASRITPSSRSIAGRMAAKQKSAVQSSTNVARPTLSGLSRQLPATARRLDRSLVAGNNFNLNRGRSATSRSAQRKRGIGATLRDRLRVGRPENDTALRPNDLFVDRADGLAAMSATMLDRFRGTAFDAPPAAGGSSAPSIGPPATMAEVRSAYDAFFETGTAELPEKQPRNTSGMIDPVTRGQNNAAALRQALAESGMSATDLNRLFGTSESLDGTDGVGLPFVDPWDGATDGFGFPFAGGQEGAVTADDLQAYGDSRTGNDSDEVKMNGYHIQNIKGFGSVIVNLDNGTFKTEQAKGTVKTVREPDPTDPAEVNPDANTTTIENENGEKVIVTRATDQKTGKKTILIFDENGNSIEIEIPKSATEPRPNPAAETKPESKPSDRPVDKGFNRVGDISSFRMRLPSRLTTPQEPGGEVDADVARLAEAIILGTQKVINPALGGATSGGGSGGAPAPKGPAGGDPYGPQAGVPKGKGTDPRPLVGPGGPVPGIGGGLSGSATADEDGLAPGESP